MGAEGRTNNCIYDSHYAETHKCKCKIGKVKGKCHDNYCLCLSYVFKKKELLLSLTGRLRETNNREEIKARVFVSRVNI
jgi:hypothetical protein